MNSRSFAASELVRHWPTLALVLITLIGAGLRFTNLGESLWLDELHTGWVTGGDWSDVRPRAQMGNQSPLWFYAVKLVEVFGGRNEYSLRFLSFAAGTALLPACYWLVRQFLPQEQTSGTEIAPLLAAALAAVDPNCIFYATEARPYACLQLAAAVQLGLFWTNLRQPTTWSRLGWILLTALVFHLHYTGILIVLGELAALLVYYIFSKNKVVYRPWRALFDWQVAVILCLPALPHLLEVAQRREMWKLMTPQPKLSELAGDLYFLFPLSGLVAIALVVLVVNAIDRVARRTQSQPSVRWPAFFFVLAWFALPLITAWTAAHFDFAQLFVRRYLMAVAIAPFLLAALLIVRVRLWWVQATMAIGLFAFAVYESQIIAQLRYDGRAIGARHEDWRGAIGWLREQQKSKPAPVVVSSGLIEGHNFREWIVVGPNSAPETYQARIREAKEYLAFPLHSIYSVDSGQQRVLPIEMLDSSVAGESDRVWVIVRGRSFVFESHPWWLGTGGRITSVTLRPTHEQPFAGVTVYEATME